MKRTCAARLVLVAFAFSVSGCGAAGLVADASVESEAEAQRHVAVHRWQRSSTVLATCPEGPEREGRPCGLLADTLSPADASAALPQRYPYASIAEMRGTCGLDPACDLRARELVWLASHNRNVARVAEERREEEDRSRRARLGVAERVVGAIAITGGLVALSLGASYR
jgi:hypothetical protein